MRTYFPFFKTLHDEQGPIGNLGRGTHYSVLRAVVFHDPKGKVLSEGQFTDFAVIWDEDHDSRVMDPIEEIYRRGLLSSFQMFGERKGAFTAILSNQISSAFDAISFNPMYVRKVDELLLSVRSANCLKNENIVYIGDLVQKKDFEIIRSPNMGRKSLSEIEEALARKGLQLGLDEVPGWPPENIEDLTKDVERAEFLETEINAICQSLNDPWTSTVVALGSGRNPIISDEEKKVSLYLNNLEMLWQLGLKGPETDDTKESLSRLMRPSGRGITLEIGKRGNSFDVCVMLARDTELKQLFTGPLAFAKALSIACELSEKSGFDGYYEIKDETQSNGKKTFTTDGEWTAALREIDRQLEPLKEKSGLDWTSRGGPITSLDLAKIPPVGPQLAQLMNLRASGFHRRPVTL
jgi:hypothetical protein